MNGYFNPSDIAPPVGRYSQGVEITNPGQTLYIAGQVGMSYCQKLVPVVFRRRVRSAFLRP